MWRAQDKDTGARIRNPVTGAEAPDGKIWSLKEGEEGSKKAPCPRGNESRQGTRPPCSEENQQTGRREVEQGPARFMEGAGRARAFSKAR